MGIRQVPVNTLEDGMFCDSVYAVRRKQLATAKTGKPYLNLTLADRTGEIVARVFRNADYFSQLFSEGEFVYVQAKVQSYEGKLQLVIDALERVAPSEVSAEDFLPAGRVPPDVLKKHMRAILETIADERIRRLCLMAMFETPEGEAFCRAPAAQNMHHAHLYGLLEHTVSVLLLLDTVSRHYTNVNRDVLLAGGLFHDFGKVYELEYARSFGYSDRGRLVPHLIIGVQLLGEWCARIPDFPAEAKLQIEHIILAHHGTREFGSPVIPATVEAQIIHQIDDMDAKVWAMMNHIEKAGPDAQWTDRHGLLGTYLRRTSSAASELYGFHLPADTSEEPAPVQPSLFGKK